MFILTDDLKQQILKHAIAHNEEVCGGIHKGVAMPWKNQHQNPKTTFLTPPFDPDQIDAIYHSHLKPEDDDFSVADIKASRASGIVYVLCHVPTQTFKIFDPNTIPPLLGRRWNWVYQNCYDLFRDRYKQLGIDLPEFYLDSPRAWLYGSVGYVENLPANGFIKLPEDTPIQKHDVILMFHVSDRAGRHPNHVAVVTDAERNAIIHHCEDQVSEIVMYSRSMRKFTHSVWRHQRFIENTL